LVGACAAGIDFAGASAAGALFDGACAAGAGAGMLLLGACGAGVLFDGACAAGCSLAGACAVWAHVGVAKATPATTALAALNIRWKLIDSPPRGCHPNCRNDLGEKPEPPPTVARRSIIENGPTAVSEDFAEFSENTGFVRLGKL
jgi:hypothetical protein